MELIGTIITKRGGLERFKGFAKPNTTPVPDEVFDRFLTELTHAELKVLMYIVRRTYGFKKRSDRISLRQIARGIVRRRGERKGEVLDRGAGITTRTAIRALKSLEARGLITVQRTRHDDGNNQINVYALRFRTGGW